MIKIAGNITIMTNRTEDDNLEFIHKHLTEWVNNLIEELKKEKLPYIEVSVNNDYTEREDSPLRRISSFFEVSMNLLINYINTPQAEKSVIQLKNLEAMLGNFLITSFKLLFNDSDSIELIQNEMKRLRKDIIKKRKDQKTETPTPQIFLDILNNKKNSN